MSRVTGAPAAGQKPSEPRRGSAPENENENEDVM